MQQAAAARKEWRDMRTELSSVRAQGQARKREGRREGRPISDEREAEVEAAGDPRERTEKREKASIHPIHSLD